jgi:ABC-type bacteriocin/lantibiotic exporter with double-glycine peptidase domain
LKHILQRNNTGCGIACIAMICNSSYSRTKKIISEALIFQRSYNYAMNYSQLRKGLRLFSIKLKYKKRFNSWKEIPKTSIVATNFSKDRRFWHWVVFVRVSKTEYYLLDPLIKNRRIKDFRGKKAGYYLEVANNN